MVDHADVDHLGIAAAEGWAPVVYPVGYSTAIALTTAEAIPANGGSIAIGFEVPSRMRLAEVSVRNTDTGTARSWGWDLYRQASQTEIAGENTLSRVLACSASDAFTPGGAASTRTLTASAVTTISAGFYWLVVQNRHATSTFGLAYTLTSNDFGPNLPTQSKTTTNPNGATLDFVAVTWTKTRRVYGAYLRGYVFGQSAIW